MAGGGGKGGAQAEVHGSWDYIGGRREVEGTSAEVILKRGRRG